jgi:hypothetical protein
MNILFENETELRKEENKIFRKFIFSKYIKLNFLSILIELFIIFIAICFFVGLIWSLIKEGVYIGALIFLLAIVFGVIKSKRDSKKEEKVYRYKYEFYEEYVTIHINNLTNTLISDSKITFSELGIKDINKYNGYIFLMNSAKGGWMINENTFTIGNKEDFEKYIQEKFNKKLKCYH